jgi:hypothetical protein
MPTGKRILEQEEIETWEKLTCSTNFDAAINQAASVLWKIKQVISKQKGIRYFTQIKN